MSFVVFVAGFLLSLVSIIYGNPINRQAGISENGNLYITVQNDTYGVEQRVCSIESMTYEDGESIPTSSPCEHCICRPPGFACTIISCEYRPGCKALKRSDQCCPEYQCECEKDGKIYQNGEKILDDNNPCEVCYCQGGDVICAVIDCYWRSDCQPRYIENRCCPLYDHCPPPSEHGPIRSTPRPTTTSTTTLSTPISWFNMSSAIYATPSTTKKPTTTTTTTTEKIAIESNNLPELSGSQETNQISQSGEETQNVILGNQSLDTAESVSEGTVHFINVPQAASQEVHLSSSTEVVPEVQNVTAVVQTQDSSQTESSVVPSVVPEISLVNSLIQQSSSETSTLGSEISLNEAQSPTQQSVSEEQTELTTSTSTETPSIAVAVTSENSTGKETAPSSPVVEYENLTVEKTSPSHPSVASQNPAVEETVPQMSSSSESSVPDRIVSSEEKLTTENPDTTPATLVQEIYPVIADVGIPVSVAVVAEEHPPIVSEIPQTTTTPESEEVNTPVPLQVSDTVIVASPDDELHQALDDDITTTTEATKDLPGSEDVLSNVQESSEIQPTEKLPQEVSQVSLSGAESTTLLSTTSSAVSSPSEIHPSTTIISSVPSLIIIPAEVTTESVIVNSGEIVDTIPSTEVPEVDLVVLSSDNLQSDDVKEEATVQSTDAPPIQVVEKLVNPTESSIIIEETTIKSSQVPVLDTSSIVKPSQNMEPPVHEFGETPNITSVPVSMDDMSLSLVPPKENSEPIVVFSQVKPKPVEADKTSADSVSDDANPSLEINEFTTNKPEIEVNEADPEAQTTKPAETETVAVSSDDLPQSALLQDEIQKEEIDTTETPQIPVVSVSSTTAAPAGINHEAKPEVPEEIVFDEKVSEVASVNAEEVTTVQPSSNNDDVSGIQFDAVPEKLDVGVQNGTEILEPDQTPIPNDHEFHPAPTTTPQSVVETNEQNEEEDEQTNKDDHQSVTETIVSETTLKPLEDKYRLDLSIFSDEENNNNTQSSNSENESSATEIVFDTINPETHLPNSLSEKVEIQSEPNDEGVSTLPPPHSERHHLPHHKEEEDTTEGITETITSIPISTVDETSIKGIRLELVKKVDPISDDLNNDFGRSDLRSDADNEVSNADSSTWYWRTYDRIRSLFPTPHPKSSRKPRSLNSDLFPRFIFW